MFSRSWGERLLSLSKFLSVATADSGHVAKTYKASLAAVTGTAQLVDGKKNNTVSLHMRNLAPGTAYLWHVHEGTCAADGRARRGLDLPDA